jgi:hypothetical protein
VTRQIPKITDGDRPASELRGRNDEQGPRAKTLCAPTRVLAPKKDKKNSGKRKSQKENPKGKSEKEKTLFKMPAALGLPRREIYPTLAKCNFHSP